MNKINNTPFSPAHAPSQPEQKEEKLFDFLQKQYAKMRALVSFHPDSNGVDKDGNTELHHALKHDLDTIADKEIKDLTKEKIDAKNGENNTHLIVACLYKRHVQVKALLEKGADSSAVGHDGNTALHYALQYGWDDTANQEIEKLTKKTINNPNNKGETPLILACIYGRYAQVNALLAKGADSSIVGPDGNTVLYYALQCGWDDTANQEIEKLTKETINKQNNKNETPLIVACIHKKHVQATALLEKGADSSAVGPRGDTPLHYALKRCWDDIADELIKTLSVEQINQKNANSHSPLIFACAYERYAQAQALLERGADIHAVSENCNTVLHFALQHGWDDIANQAIKSLTSDTLDAKNEDNDTHLILACKHGRAAQVKALLELGASVDAEDSDEKTALHHALEKGWDDIADFIIGKLTKETIDKKDKNSNTPLMVACDHKKLKQIRALLERGADMNALVRRKDTVLCHAIKRSTEKVSQLLIQYLPKEKVDCKNRDQETYLSVACSNKKYGPAKALIAKGADINAVDCAEYSVLYYALEHGWNDIADLAMASIAEKDLGKMLVHAGEYQRLAYVKTLIAKGASLNTVDEQGRTILYYALKNGWNDIANKAIENFTAEAVNQVDTQGDTALLIACKYKRKAGAQALIAKGANINAKNNNGDRVLESALEHGWDDIANKAIENIPDRYLKAQPGERDPLEIASRFKRKAQVRKLLAKGANINFCYGGNRSPTFLHYAIRNGWNDLALSCIPSLSTENLNKVDTFGMTSLILACRLSEEAVAEALLKQRDVNKDNTTFLGNTALYWVVKNNLPTLLPYFVSQQGHWLRRNHKKMTPLHHLKDKSPEFFSKITSEDKALLLKTALVNGRFEEFGYVSKCLTDKEVYNLALRLCFSHPKKGRRCFKHFGIPQKQLFLESASASNLLRYVRSIFACLSNDEAQKFLQLIIKKYPTVLAGKDLFNVQHRVNYAHMEYGWEAIPKKPEGVEAQHILNSFSALNFQEASQSNYCNPVMLETLGAVWGGILKYLVDEIAAHKATLKNPPDLEPLYNSVRSKRGVEFETYEFRAFVAFLLRQLQATNIEDLQKKLQEKVSADKRPIHQWIDPKITTAGMLEATLLLNSLVEKVRNKTQFNGVWRGEYASHFYDDVERALTNAVLLLGKVDHQKKYDTLREYLKGLSVCGGQLHRSSTAMYESLFQGKTYETALYKALARTRENIFLCEIPQQDTQNIHVYYGLLKAIGSDFGVPGATQQGQDPYSRLQGVDADDVLRRCSENYTGDTILAGTKIELKSNLEFRELYSAWWKKNTPPAFYKELYDKIAEARTAISGNREQFIEWVKALQSTLTGKELQLCTKLVTEVFPYLDDIVSAEVLEETRQDEFIYSEVYEDVGANVFREKYILENLSKHEVITKIVL